MLGALGASRVTGRGTDRISMCISTIVCWQLGGERGAVVMWSRCGV